jgi:outer membrane receptor for ferrienterochelin and colicin
VRRVRGDGFADYYYDPVRRERVENHRGNETLEGGYAQQSWSVLGQRLSLSGGMRWDRLDVSGIAVASPQASVAVLPWRSARVQVTWGEYAQFPDVNALFSAYGSRALAPERSTHFAATFEQRLGALTRLRVQAYERNDRDLLYRPYLEARLVADRIVGDDFAAPLTNSLRGRARGVEFFVQRRTANRWNGWVSYSLNYADMRDGVTGIRFPSDQDQRHTMNAYVGYRIRPSVNLSTKWTYGSGFPVPGFVQKSGDSYVLAPARNGARLDPYQRTDVRINKSKTFDRRKMTVYAEVVNVFNRPNYRFDSYNGYDPSGRAYLSFMKMFPVLPAAGIMFEF